MLTEWMTLRKCTESVCWQTFNFFYTRTHARTHSWLTAGISEFDLELNTFLEYVKLKHGVRLLFKLLAYKSYCAVLMSRGLLRQKVFHHRVGFFYKVKVLLHFLAVFYSVFLDV